MLHSTDYQQLTNYSHSSKYRWSSINLSNSQSVVPGILGISKTFLGGPQVKNIFVAISRFACSVLTFALIM